jgi:hypothetical protein
MNTCSMCWCILYVLSSVFRFAKVHTPCSPASRPLSHTAPLDRPPLLLLHTYILTTHTVFNDPRLLFNCTIRPSSRSLALGDRCGRRILPSAHAVICHAACCVLHAWLTLCLYACKIQHERAKSEHVRLGRRTRSQGIAKDALRNCSGAESLCALYLGTVYSVIHHMQC